VSKKEKENLQALQEVCEQAACYVGQANYDYREALANWNIRKAFEDFQDGKKPKWTEQEEDQPL
jgi:uncharacterized protein YfaT (DUF1175 family)